MFAVSDVTWNNRSCLYDGDDDPDFVVDGNTEVVLLDGDLSTCLYPLNSNRSYLRLHAYVYTPMTKDFVLEMSVTELDCESPGILLYYEQRSAGCDEGNLLQCRVDGSNTGVFPCRFSCSSPYQLKTTTRVVIQIEILPWEMLDSSERKLCGLTTIIP